MGDLLAILKALADESRLRILVCLDRSPLCLCQLTEILGLATSTMSRHMQVLVQAGLVRTWTEGRWRYYTLDRRQMSSAAGEMAECALNHVRSSSAATQDLARKELVMKSAPAPCSEVGRPRVLFLCTGNSCRSQMAEALLRKYAGDHFEAFSAGLDPRPIHPMTLEVMAEIGLNLAGHRPKSVLEFLGKAHFAYLITVCSQAEARCPIFPGVSYRLYWPFNDPAAAEGDEQRRRQAFRSVRDEIDERINSWLGDMEAGDPSHPGQEAGSRMSRIREQNGSETTHDRNGGEL